MSRNQWKLRYKDLLECCSRFRNLKMHIYSNHILEVPLLISVLRKKYLKAVQVEMVSNSTSLIIAPTNETTKIGRQQRSIATQISPALGELVFIEQSPDICQLKHKNGAPLIVGRECFNEKECDDICCNRGFIRIREQKKQNCNCRFIYCCRVDCDECAIEIERFYCK